MKMDKDDADFFASCCKLIIMALIYSWGFNMVNRAVGAIEDIRDAVVQMARE